ncbi:MAG: 3-alpha-hydroxysteroid dehydrogenase [Hyphomicrobiales bacterium]|nr:3-alpha-hydroxysteroid dehydrogenase [Hyphomicrobiales bacterium]
MRALEGRVAIITGAAGGQGRAEAAAFAAAGATVVATDLSDDLVSTFADNDTDTRFVCLKHDVTRDDDWQRIVGVCLERWGRIDILVNNAGVYRPASLLETDGALYDLHMNVNARSVFLGMRAVAPPMMEARSGTIINIASGAGAKGTVGLFAYSTSKWAVRGMTRSAARELAPFNIRVNAVLPGLIDTAMVSAREGREAFIGKVPLGRIGNPDEVARLVLFLAAESHSYITGAEIPVDGGYSA